MFAKAFDRADRSTPRGMRLASQGCMLCFRHRKVRTMSTAWRYGSEFDLGWTGRSVCAGERQVPERRRTMSRDMIETEKVLTMAIRSWLFILCQSLGGTVCAAAVHRGRRSETHSERARTARKATGVAATDAWRWRPDASVTPLACTRHTPFTSRFCRFRPTSSTRPPLVLSLASLLDGTSAPSWLVCATCRFLPAIFVVFFAFYTHFQGKAPCLRVAKTDEDSSAEPGLHTLRFEARHWYVTSSIIG